MADLASAHPRGTFAFRQTSALGFSRLARIPKWPLKTRASVILQVVAAAHLAALGAFELLPGSPPPLLLAMTGLALALLALDLRHVAAAARQPAVLEDTPAGQSATGEPRCSEPEKVPDCHGREFALEWQSQRLVEIADQATRARNAAEDRSRAWAQLMAQVSHELRTPLNAVIGFSDVMDAEIFGPVGHPRYREYVDHIRDSGRALLKSAEDTLVLTQLLTEPGPLRSSAAIDFSRAATDAWAFHAPAAAERDIAIEIAAEPSLQILGDRRLLRQVLVNLFAEAMRRAGDGSRIELTARTEGDLAELALVVRGGARSRPEGSSLPLSLARALLELQDAFLVELPSGPTEWRVVTMLARSAQQDFFAADRPSDWTPARAC